MLWSRLYRKSIRFYKFFLNMASKNGSPELISMLQYMKETRIDNPEIIVKDSRILELDEIVTEVKESEEWEAVQMNMYEILMEKGMKEGMEKGMQRGMEKGMQKGMEKVKAHVLIDHGQMQRLAGAALDVFEKEPIPVEDSLWECPRLLITPHIAGNMTLDYTVEKIVDQFLEDLENYAAGRSLRYRVDRERAY